MKVLILSRYQNITERGAETFVKELASHLSSDISVRILSGQSADSLKNILSEKADIVIPINGRTQALKASIGRVFGGYKLVISGHSGIGRDDYWNLFVFPDIFVALTKKAENWAKRSSWGVKIKRVPNGIDLNKFNPIGENVNMHLSRPIVLSVGALTESKHHERLIKAASIIKTVSVLIVGKGGQYEQLQNIGQGLLGDRFQIKNVSYLEMPKIYRSVDLFSLPSWDRESFGIVYLEAMASGLGVVAPDDENRREIVGQAGILTDVSDEGRYAQAIDKALKINWKKASREQAERFSWENVAKIYEDIFKEVLNK